MHGRVTYAASADVANRIPIIYIIDQLTISTGIDMGTAITAGQTKQITVGGFDPNTDGGASGTVDYHGGISSPVIIRGYSQTGSYMKVTTSGGHANDTWQLVMMFEYLNRKLGLPTNDEEYRQMLGSVDKRVSGLAPQFYIDP